ncbi:MAG: hypothetical protein RJB08_1715, partial [Actinomycetota bacterium]
GRTGFVRRSDIDEPCARLLDHLGNPESTADLDAFTARHGDVPIARKCRSDEQNGCGIVVDDHGVFGAGEFGEKYRNRGLPRSARSVGEIEFERRWSSGSVETEQRTGQRRTTEVGVQENPGCVDDRSNECELHSFGNFSGIRRVITARCDCQASAAHEQRVRQPRAGTVGICGKKSRQGIDGRWPFTHEGQPNRWLACIPVVVLFVIFVALPLAEIYALIKIGSWIGVFPTIALLLLVSAVGAVLVKREGLRVLRRMQEQVAAGNMPSNEILDGVCLLLAGLLLLVPGFVTDAVGLLLLLPPFRVLLRALLKRRSGRKIKVVATYSGRIVNNGQVYDVQGHYDNRQSPPKELEQ